MIWLALFVVVISYLVFNLVNSLNYWKKRNVVYQKTWPIVGNLKDLVLRRKNLAYVVQDWYKEFPEKRYYGTYSFTVQCLFVRDLDLIKRITVKDFDHFVDHINVTDSEQEPVFGKNLIALRGQQWKDMRNTLSPSFTGNKIRIMFHLISDCAKQFNEHFLAKDKEVIEIEAKDLMTRIAVDVIATIAFGLQCDSIKEDSQFYKMGTALTKTSLLGFFRAIIQVMLPKLAKKLKISQILPEASQFFQGVIKETLKEREEKGIVRPDMIHILMEARKGKKMPQEEIHHLPDTGFAAVDETEPIENIKQEITVNDIVAQGFLFFLAGFEPVSTLLAHICNELAVNPTIQEKLQTEIDAAFEETNGDLNYETLVKMKYLDMVVCETLRKWPPSSFTNRECVQEYKIEASAAHGEDEITIDKGVGIIIPTYAIHHDPKYYPNPDKFDPERFSDENKHNINPYTYLPFGIGPRNCIGSRLALLEAKVLITYLLGKFDIVVVEKTRIPLVLSPKKPGLVPDEFWLGLTKRRF